jgi:hypothetical protein
MGDSSAAVGFPVLLFWEAAESIQEDVMRALVAAFAILFFGSLFGFFGVANFIQNSTGDLFSRSPVIVDGITPAEIKTNFIYFKVTADGPFRTVSVSESRDTRTFDFGVDGWCTGDCTPRPAEKVKLVRITSRDPKKELHFTLRECRLRATLLSHTLECYDGK